MYKIYFKQAIQMLKQNKFISIISILGTALAIMMIMTLIVSDEVKTISISPENNRDRTLYINYQVKRDTLKGSMESGNITPGVYKDYLMNLETPECITLMNSNTSKNTVVNVEGSSDYILSGLRLVDDSFWKLFSFDFIAGTAFSKEEFMSGIHHVILSSTTARKLFKGEKALGRTIQIGFKNYKVTGVVKDISPVFKWAGGDLWIPYTSSETGKTRGTVLLLAKKKEDFPKIIAEVREAERKFGIDQHPWLLYLEGPRSQKTLSTDIYGNNAEEFNENIKITNRRTLLIFLILLIVPALNLSGFSLSRIKRRTAEIGVRKAFGAKRHVILLQILYENMITSLLGGMIGLIFSYITVIRLRNWLLDIPAGSDIPIGTLVSPAVFLAVFTACLLLNLLSAGASAYKASRMTIVHSLNQNNR